MALMCSPNGNIKMIRDIIKIIVLTWPSFMKIGLTIWTLKCSQGFCALLPSDLHFTPSSTWFIPHQNIIKTIILTKLNIGLQMWYLERSQGFCIIWPSGQLFYPIRSRLDHDRDIIKPIILIKFHEDNV